MTGQTCSHGIPWSEDCPQCNLVWARGTVERLGPVVDEARALIEAAASVNQCDGCRVSAPLSRLGHHQMPDGGFMGCTKDRYVESEAERTVRELTEGVEGET